MRGFDEGLCAVSAARLKPRFSRPESVCEILLGQPELQGALLLRGEIDEADADVAALVLPGDFRFRFQA